MLKNIHPCLCPELLHALASMGHGDELVIADANFSTHGHPRVIRAGGYEITVVLEAVLRLLPLDRLAVNDAALVIQPPSDCSTSPIQFIAYQDILRREEGDWVHVVPVERHHFLEKCRKSYAVVITTDCLLNASIILRKGALIPMKPTPLPTTTTSTIASSQSSASITTPSPRPQLVSAQSGTSTTKILSVGARRKSLDHGVEHLGAVLIG